MSAPSYLNPHRAPAFGYCDSKGNNSPLTAPRNPYTAGTDGFDLSWAVDRDGQPVELDTVHFVRIYNAGFANIGWLGEWSTEVLKVAITTPDPAYVPEDYYRHYIGLTQLHVLKGHTCHYDGLLFKNGRPQAEGTPRWWTSNPAVATVDNDGNLSAHEPGEVWLYFSQKSDVQTDSVPVAVVELESVILELEGNSTLSSDSTSLHVNEKIYIIGECGDSRTATLNGSRAHRFVYEPLRWTSSRPEVGTIDNGLFTGLAPGETMVYAAATSRPDLVDSMWIVVKPVPDVNPVHESIRIPIAAPQGSYKPSELFTTGTGAEIILNSVASTTGASSPRIEKNTFLYRFEEGESAADTVRFNLTVFGKDHERDIVFSYSSAVRRTEKQLLFTHTDPDGNQTVKSWMPLSGETGTLLALSSETVEDMRLDGAYLFVATGTGLYRCNASTGEIENRIPIGGEPKKMQIAGNRLFVSSKQDGTNWLAVYHKSDLSPADTLRLPGQLAAMTAFGDTIYALINSADHSSLAVVNAGLNAVSIEKTIDWGSDGLNVTDLIGKGDTLFAVRPQSDAAPAAVITFRLADETRTVTGTPNVEYQAFNTSALIEPMAGNLLLLKNKRGFTEFNTLTLTPKDATTMNDRERMAAGAACDPLEGKYYVAHIGNASSVGTIFSANYDKESSFDGLGSNPRILRFLPALTENDRPALKTPISSAFVVERKPGATVTVSKANAFDDQENDFRIYPKSGAPFLTWERSGENLRYTPYFDGHVAQDSTVTIEIEAIDHYGCATVSPFTLTIRPRIYAPRISTPLIDPTVAADAGNLELSLSETFEFFEANVPATNVKTLHANSNPALVTATVDAENDLLRLAFAPGQKGQATVTVRGATVETSPDDPEQPESKYVDAVITVTAGNGETGIALPPAARRLIVYPSPSSGNITVLLDEAQPVVLFNITGQPVKAFDGKTGPNPVDISNLPSGIYLLKTPTANMKITKN
ncbi:MAG: T9SS type A sorting domain-containing protein [Tannerella sp.]|jgi:hypothetical protein|nr:T9SS type A sorting domain-containing protein [Tannerella sp.]